MTQGSDGWVEQARAESLRQLENIAEMQQRLAAVSGEAESGQGRVRVRVTPAGMPTDLQISDSAMSLSGSELAALVMSAVATATVRASEQLKAIVGPVIGEEQLDAMMRGTASATDVADVREQIDVLRGQR
ncbi:YbaB/EbfC family nucleoid-associated protein [Nocardioides houyundeii]|uniref:YbaB/EbfC family nucleoid-associated protein n=1 Tax=Nocardioides houyundeii TaxID=2045452 RepID=UPI000C756787|nr:YbaB/EbfC family nucleoid-associated protein [Nocardioides houyundeii]